MSAVDLVCGSSVPRLIPVAGDGCAASFVFATAVPARTLCGVDESPLFG
jgi:hypothetical protein